MSLSLSLPKLNATKFIRLFADGLASDQNYYKIKLLGGDLTASPKLISITILNVLIGLCAAMVVKKTVGILRLWEYRYFLKNIKKYTPVLKRQMTRREFISLKLFTLKNA